MMDTHPSLVEMFDAVGLRRWRKLNYFQKNRTLGMPNLYDSIGTGYTAHRKADPRITGQLIALLNVPPGAWVADIGAGTGNYSCALADHGFGVRAIEPSSVMKQQAKEHKRVAWAAGVAEATPLPAASIDAVVCILASHHFTSVSKAIAEMHRICPQGPIVWFTFDPRQAQSPWFADYFPEIWSNAFPLFPPLDELARLFGNITGRKVDSHVFELPPDLEDRFLAAYWQEPSTYLREDVRQSMSAFAVADPEYVESGLVMLSNDLSSGNWYEKYGHIAAAKSVDWGYRFVVAR